MRLEASPKGAISQVHCGLPTGLLAPALCPNVLDQRREMRRNRSFERVILILEGLPDCEERNVSSARGRHGSWRGTRDDTSANPIIDSISYGGGLAHDVSAS